MKKISSLENSRIKKIVKMRKANNRKESFLIEGEKELSLALLSDIFLKEVYFCNDFSFDKNILKKIGQEKLFEVNKDVFKKISLRKKPDGILAIAKNQNFSLSKVDLTNISIIAVLEKVEKPGNIGAIIRSIDAIGKAMIVLIEPQTSFFNPNVVRTSRGAVFTIPKAVCNQNEFFEWIKEKKIKVFATTPKAQKKYLDIQYPDKLVLLLGAEHDGLSKELLKIADEKIKIPMNGKIDSLNVSVSSAIVLYEILRQRDFIHKKASQYFLNK